MMKHATFAGDDAEFRLTLIRLWDAGAPMLVVCMLNPSTADASIDDPTILALIHFATLWGYGGILVVNLFAVRTSSPKDMKNRRFPVGRPYNEAAIDDALAYARATTGKLLVAWGNDGGWQERDVEFLSRCDGLELVCLGRTQSGAPKHPMARGQHRIPRDQQPIPFTFEVLA
jgi:hypothetical protein